MNETVYHVPANFTDAGKLFGIFAIRNAVEAVVLGLPILFFCAHFLPLAATAKIIVTMILFVPAAGFALAGIGDDSLSGYAASYWRWRRRKRILTYRGETDYFEFERAYLRRRKYPYNGKDRV